jgi:hypothetical protein
MLVAGEKMSAERAVRVAGAVTFKKAVGAVRRLGRGLQTLVVQFLLAFLYVFGFGLTKAWMLIFHRRLYRFGAAEAASFWLTPKDGEFDARDSERQS